MLVVAFGSDLEVMIQLGYLATARKVPPTQSEALRDAVLYSRLCQNYRTDNSTLTQKRAGSETQLQRCVTISDGHRSRAMRIIRANTATANMTSEFRIISGDITYTPVLITSTTSSMMTYALSSKQMDESQSSTLVAERKAHAGR